MSDAARLRDSTQIVIPEEAIGGLRAELGREFTLTVFEEGDTVRLIGSPVEIKRASDWLARHGVTVP